MELDQYLDNMTANTNVIWILDLKVREASLPLELLLELDLA